jgi:hypothetical protein
MIKDPLAFKSTYARGAQFILSSEIVHHSRSLIVFC